MNADSKPSLTISSLLKRTTRPILLLGAGCSVRSGIPTAESLVSEIGKWGYCVANARHVDDPSLVRSDWWPWLTKQNWYRHDLHLANQYPSAVEALLRPQEDRKAFFHKVLSPGLPASRGYQVLAQLLARRIVVTVLTTNFDQLLAGECRSTAAVHHVEEIRTPDDFKLISTSPEHPQIIYVHGSVDHYTDQNIEQETQRLNQTLVESLSPLLRDHPLVVLGYRGTEASVMQHLLLDQADRCAGYRRGIYWCHRRADSPAAGSPLLSQLAATVGGNFQFVQIDGFDELMIELSDQLPDLLLNSSSGGAFAASSAPQQVAHDLRFSNIDLADLDRPLLKAKIVAYCEAVRLPPPSLSNDALLIEAMTARNLAVKEKDKWHPTIGAQLRFARTSGNQLKSGGVLVAVDGDPDWVNSVLLHQPSNEDDKIDRDTVIDGNLWVQLEMILSLLARVNRPFRLKGHTSREIYPYPPLALKEIVTNLLAHREYDNHQLSRIRISPNQIVFENPGGLTDHVRKQLKGQDMQSVIQGSSRGIKGYRNPVIADFFFSAGAMDKEGSGLPDVVSEAANNLNSLAFGPIDENNGFSVSIFARPETLTIDPKTRTARSAQREVRYSPNLLSVSGWPQSIWRIPTLASRGDLRLAREGGAPPFCQMGDSLWTFADPADERTASLLHLASQGKIETHATTDFLGNEFAHSAVPRLLNSALEQHLDHLSLCHRFVGNSIRAYFPAEGMEARFVSYRGLFKQAKRTVAKPITSRATNQISFWEHKAISLRFERFGITWSMSLLPTYVFTTDGLNNWIESHRIGPKTTTRTARDYNPTVLHNLVFWSRVLSQTTEGGFHLPLDGLPPAPGSPTTGNSLELVSLVPIATFEENAEHTNASLESEAFVAFEEYESETEELSPETQSEASSDDT